MHPPRRAETRHGRPSRGRPAPRRGSRPAERSDRGTGPLTGGRPRRTQRPQVARGAPLPRSRSGCARSRRSRFPVRKRNHFVETGPSTSSRCCRRDDRRPRHGGVDLLATLGRAKVDGDAVRGPIRRPGPGPFGFPRFPCRRGRDSDPGPASGPLGGPPGGSLERRPRENPEKTKGREGEGRMPGWSRSPDRPHRVNGPRRDLPLPAFSPGPACSECSGPSKGNASPPPSSGLGAGHSPPAGIAAAGRP